VPCHEEVLEAARSIVQEKGDNAFTPQEVVDHLRKRLTAYSESTIRIHVVSRCCYNAPRHHAVKHEYFERIGRASYKIRPDYI
jgi:hypothetical protein